MTASTDNATADFWADAEIIHAYTRAQALRGGELVDAGDLAREVGFRTPVALTRAAWEGCVEWTDADNERKGTVQDQTGRLWDVLWMAINAARRGREGSRVEFELLRVPRTGRGQRAVLHRLALMIGPGDEGEPVITIGEPHED